MWQLGQKLIVLLLCLSGVVILQLPRANEDQSEITEEEAIKEEQQKKLRIGALQQMPDFGYSNLLANWIFLDFVQYYGDRVARNLTGNTLSADYFQAVVRKDPRFVDSYFFLAPATSLFAGKPDLSVELMEEGLEKISPTQPLAYQIWSYKGIDEMLFLGDHQAAIESYNKALEWTKYHNTEQAEVAAMRAQQAKEFLETNPDSRLVRASAWLMIYSNARDDQTRELARSEVEKDGLEIVVSGNFLTVVPREPKKNEE